MVQRNPIPRRVCFVTGTRAEFGLMRSTLQAIRDQPALELQIVATGMHLSKAHGNTLAQIRNDGWTVNATVPWKVSPHTPTNAIQTGKAIAGIAAALNRLKTDIVLVVGDRVEAFAGATAGHLAGLAVAHVHGGDRALGQVDDSLRHAITKLSHLHFPATVQSKQRILNLGEDQHRVRWVGSPGVDGITAAAASADANLRRRQFALLILHPTDTDESLESKRASMVLNAVRKIGFKQIVVVYPNNDPGSQGIMRFWDHAVRSAKNDLVAYRDVPRPQFLAMMREAAVLIGNSSSGIIEAASFGTPVIDIGPRQQGRERSQNVINVPFSANQIHRELRRVWNNGTPIRYPKKNVYGGNGAGGRIAKALANVDINAALLRKLITY